MLWDAASAASIMPTRRARGMPATMVWDVPNAVAATTTRQKTTPNTPMKRNAFGAGTHDGDKAHGQSNAVGGPRAS
eukprot:1284673-Pyramimonas_sp.AAC.1